MEYFGVGFVFLALEDLGLEAQTEVVFTLCFPMTFAPAESGGVNSMTGSKVGWKVEALPTES